jgi:hypothetical protein
MPMTKEEKKEYDRIYREENKDKIKEKRKDYLKEYYTNNKDKINQQNKEYYTNNKDKIKQQNKERYEANKEEIKENHKKYRENNKNIIKEKLKEYNQTENGIKTRRIRTWRRLGVICEDFDNLYEKYINTNNCEECNVELISGIYGVNKKCLDHDHETGLFRNVLCHICNLKRK